MVHALLTLLLAYIVPRCAGVITVSPPIVQAINQRYGVKHIALIRNILPYCAVQKNGRLKQFLNLGEHVKIALYQGYLQPDRSLDLLVRAAAYLKPPHVIVLMGQGVGTTQEQLEKLIAQEGVEDRIKIIPAVPYQELLAWTASADLGLIVGIPEYTRNVRMLLPNKFFEYLMAGVPVLSAPLEAVVEIIQAYEVGAIIPSFTPAVIGAAINTLLSDSEALEAMAQQALAAAHNEFSWEKESKHLLHFYQNLLLS